MRRRPPQKAGVSAVLSLVLLCIPFLVTAQQQHSSQGLEPAVAQGLESPASESTISLDNDAHLVPRKNTHHNNHNNNRNHNAASDVRALATLAPSGRLLPNGDVRAPPARTSGNTVGLSSRLPARSLQDWEVEDIVLMATVDGMIHARDRNTGAPRWSLESHKPMVETIYHPRKSTDDGVGGGKNSTQKFYWIVEPSQDGSLYGYTPGAPFGMVKLGLTVKQLVEDLAPYDAEDPPVVYTGKKSNTLFKIDINTGHILKTYHPEGSQWSEPDVCRRGGGLESLDDDECGQTATLTLGRTDYKVGIQSSVTGEQICTINYFEWSPNNRDRDLLNQYQETKDNRYIYSLHDGRVMALDYIRSGGPSGEDKQKPMFKHKFQSPVVRVFDVVRPTRSTALDTPLVILPHPTGPPLVENSFLRDDSRVFVNCTEAGSWYALSEMAYPMVTDGALDAQCALRDWRPTRLLDGSEEEFKKALVGVHELPNSIDAWPTNFPALPAPTGPNEIIPSPTARNSGREESLPVPGPPSPKPEIVDQTYLGGLLALIIFFVVLSGAYWKVGLKNLRFPSQARAHINSGAADSGTLTQAIIQDAEIPVNQAGQQLEGIPGTATLPIDSIEDSAETMKAIVNEKPTVSVDDNKENKVPQAEQATEAIEAALAVEATVSKTQPLVDASAGPDSPSIKPKKTAHRGQRGGKREKEKRKLRQGMDDEEEAEGEDFDTGPRRRGKDIVVVAQAIKRTADGGRKLGLFNLHFALENKIADGSGGTAVFRGTFEGRDVAVKRMLVAHYELALQEVSLLENSEDHPNVVRYFCRREDEDFLYIALELCQASLYDVFKDRRHDPFTNANYMAIIEQINKSPVTAMRQLAEGLKHLHALRIVHRDIKPQNLLVAYPKKNSISTFPRLVISDFGLCKTLPEGASTVLGATINAGTTGWKAPELIHHPRDASLVTGSQNSVSNGSMNASGEPQPGAPGVKRAVDIFSLGCVFFYILTQGLHPFDDEEGWLALRERNIKKNRCNLSAIEIHGPDTIDLIKWMLSPKPEDRPTAAEVLAHPFFWTPEDRLEFLSLSSDRFDMESRDGTSVLLDELEARAEEIIPPGPSSVSILSASPPRNSANWNYAAHKRSLSDYSSPRPPLSYDEITFPPLGSTATPPPVVAVTLPPPPPPEPNFLAALDKKFIDTLGKQRKYNGARLADLLRALRNKHHHWDDMPDDVKAKVGEVPEGYLRYWETRFPGLVVGVWRVVRGCGVAEERRFGRWFGGRV